MTRAIFKPEPASTDLSSLPYGRQWIEEDDIEAVVECLRSDRLTQGPLVEQFERSLCAATGAHFAVAVNSGTAALHLAAQVAGVGSGDTGITSAITFVASANCIAYCGGEPHFADVCPDTALIDLNSLQDCIERLSRVGRPPRLLVPVNFAGQPADLPSVHALAQSCGAKVVEDAAHSLGAVYSYRGEAFRSGGCAHTDMAILSFHPVKHVTTGEGGAVLTNDATLAGRLYDLRNHGIHRNPARFTRSDQGPWYYEQADLGYNYRLTDIQCALGLSQLRKLERFIVRRNEIARHYDEAFASGPLSDWAKPLHRRLETMTHAYHLYVIRLTSRPGETVEEVAARRMTLYLFLQAKKIYTQVHYIPVPLQPFYRKSRGDEVELISGAQAYYSSCLSLPMYPMMNDQDVRRVLGTLEKFIQ